jgi:hypothetical protein
MAIITKVETDYGVIGEYVKISNVTINTRRVTVSYQVYLDKLARLEGKQPLTSKTFSDAFDSEYILPSGNALEVAYGYLKDKVEFIDPIDDLDTEEV